METNTRYLEILQANKSYLQQQFAVDSLVVFGSVARNEMTEDSDVDIFVQMPPKMLLVIGIKQYLESLLNRPVDVVRNHPNMNPLLKKQIEKMFVNKEIDFNNEIFISNERQLSSIKKAKVSLQNVLSSIKQNVSEDFNYLVDA